MRFPCEMIQEDSPALRHSSLPHLLILHISKQNTDTSMETRYNCVKRECESIALERWIMDIDIGEKIRDLRTKSGMKIKDLATKADVSSSLISQIERNKVAPSVTVMYRIAKALSVSVGFFFDEDVAVKTNPVVRRNERKTLRIDGSSAVYELLSPDTNQDIEFLYIALKAGEISNAELISHEGEECGFVLKGHMLVKLGQDEYYLGEGDAISFKSTIPHRYINIGDRECISIWAMTPPSF